MQNIIYLTLDVGHRVDVSHDWNLEGFLTTMSNDSKHKVVIWMKEALIEEKSSIQNSKIGTFLDVGNDLRLEGQGVGVRENHLIEFSYVHHCSVFSFALSIKLPDDKH